MTKTDIDYTALHIQSVIQKYIATLHICIFFMTRRVQIHLHIFMIERYIIIELLKFYYLYFLFDDNATVFLLVFTYIF